MAVLGLSICVKLVLKSMIKIRKITTADKKKKKTEIATHY